MSGSLALFLSYAHEDEPYRSELEKHLAALRNEGLVDVWHDRKITAGTDWERELHTSLDSSNVILLLISPDFMTSRYINEVEVRRAMQRHEMGTARVVPVLIRPADWEGAPFSKLQAIPTGPRPISEWESSDAGFVDVAGHLREVCREVKATPGNPANPYVEASIGDWYEMEVMVDVHSTGETKLASARIELVDRNAERALLRMEIRSDDLGDDERTIEIPLDRPLEDSMGSVVGAVGAPIPPNAMVETRQTGAGRDKLFIGGRTYYTTWVDLEVEFRLGRERAVQKGRRWLSPEVPLDGIVKTVSEVPGVATQTMIVTGFGRAGSGDAARSVRAGASAPSQPRAKRGSRPKPADGARRPVLPPEVGEVDPREPPLTLHGVIAGRWNVTISQAFGEPLSATFHFDPTGMFMAQMMSPMVGLMNMQGRWLADGRSLGVEGVQSAGMMNAPYAARVDFDTVSRGRLEGSTLTGERVVFVRA